MKTMFRSLFLTLLILNFSSFTWADVKLPALISNHMVLQKSPQTAIWGKADSGEIVRVNFAGFSSEVTADKQGKWKLLLDTREFRPGPWELVVEGKNKIVVSDVLVGEVWLASGQSNMEFPLDATQGAREEIAGANDLSLRMFRVTSRPQAEPAEDCVGNWVVATPGTAGTFSAVAYYFAKDLRKTLDTPVGVIQSAWGGTPIEAWMSLEALDSNPDLKSGRLRNWKRFADVGSINAKFVSDYADWLKKNQREDPSQDPQLFAIPQLDLAGWNKVILPSSGVSPGVLWLRREVDLPASVANKPLKISFPDGRGFRSVYWNGEKISQSSYTDPDKLAASTSVPANLVKTGRNVIAIRIFSPAEPASIYGEAQKFLLRTTNSSNEWSLAGEWFAKQEHVLPPSSSRPPAPPPLIYPQATASYLFNSRINPLRHYAIRGIIWYQGENNTGRAVQYRDSFPLMIKDWRKAWGRGDEIPFYFCQLANYREQPTVPEESDWAELREAQEKTRRVPNVGRAVLIDVGEIGDIHPRNKKEVGSRLARIALAKDYNQPQVYESPFQESHVKEGDKIRIQFDSSGGTLIAAPIPAQASFKSLTGEMRPIKRNSPDSQLEGFAICGPDRVWVWANAKIDGNTVVVWSPQVSDPVAVRYAWAENPICNLFNTAGLPASPFRTDDFPLSTESRKF